MTLPIGETVTGGPARRPGTGPYEGRHVRLRALRPAADVEPLFAAAHGTPERESLWAYMAYGPFAGPQAMGTWLEACAASSDPLFLCVEGVADGRPVGMATFMSVRPEMRVLELGNIWYVPEAQRTAANTETAYLMLREAFEVLGYRRIEWKCDALNERSRRAALRLGFAFEGVFRQHMIVKGRNRDTAWFAMLDADWPRARRVLEQRLEEGTR